MKPAVCGNPLCVFSHAQYGLGEDVSTFIRKNPEVADLLICTTYAASQGDIRRFEPFPVGIEVPTSGPLISYWRVFQC